jgi:hypothetical protein
MPDYRSLVQVEDNCPGPITREQFPAPGTILTAITTPANMVFTDASGNRTIVQFDVHLWDTVGPTVLPYTDTIIGFVDPFNESTTVDERRAQEYVAEYNLLADHVGQWHDAGPGTRAIFAVHGDTIIDGEHRPGKTLVSTGVVDVGTAEGNEEWPIPAVFIPEGMRYWVSWVYENNPGIRTQPGDGTLHRARADGQYFADGMPDYFGPSSISNYNYSVYLLGSRDLLAYSPEMVAQMYLEFEEYLRYFLNFFIQRFGWDIVGGDETIVTHLKIPVRL